jgi:hypothetical protein
MWATSVLSLAVFALLHEGVLSQIPLCESNLRYGGACVDLRAACPTGSFEYSAYSNYVGCVRVDRKCCANSQGIVRNPGGIEVTPPPPATCGLGSLEPSSRILDGVLTGPCDWPFAASIRNKKDDSSPLTYAGTQHACQGVIIGTRWVLTSPSCIISYGNTADEAPFRMLVVVGEYNVSGIDIDPVTGGQMEQVIRIDRVFINPNYGFQTQAQMVPFLDRTAINSNAVALVKLVEPIIGRCSGIACLPTPEEAANSCAGYDDCVITGWGYDNHEFRDLKDELLLGRVRLTSKVACDYLTQRLNISSSRPTGSACQSPAEANTNACLGDEGGAVLCSNGFNWVVRGILPLNLCDQGRYDIFVTDVAPYLSWIQTTMNN